MTDFNNKGTNLGIETPDRPWGPIKYNERYHYGFTHDRLPRSVIIEYDTERVPGTSQIASLYKRIGTGRIIIPSDVPMDFPDLQAAIARAKIEHSL